MFGHDSQQDQKQAHSDQPDEQASSTPVITEPAATDLSVPDPTTASNSDTRSLSIPSITTPQPSGTVGIASDDLLSIKQEALQELSPLIGHLEQTPEEKFRTTMMMIQAADNQSLIKDAYDAAKQISDEKARAQALLDIVNEINYFTQHPQA